MPEYEPVEVYFPTNGGGDARFGQDLTDEESQRTTARRMAGADLIQHPDGEGEDQALCRRRPVADLARPRGKRASARTAAECLEEIQARSAVDIWNGPTPEQWPPTTSFRAHCLELTARTIPAHGGAGSPHALSEIG